MEEIKYAKINRLPDTLIAQLKAGEIIENPAQVIKELIDNSIDASSTEITIHIEQSGLLKILIEDNGIGMSQEDVLLAFSQHTTSKLTHIFDLFQLNSFGFRGEALFSIKNAGNLLCESSREGVQTTINFIQNEEPFIEIKNTKKNGTKIVLTDLFKYNPVRLKFLLSEQKERRKIQHILLTFFISHPNIHFKVELEDQFSFYPSTSLKQRIENFFTIEDSIEDSVKKLFILKNSKQSYIYVNNRYIINYKLTKFLEEKLGKKFILFLTINGNELDINVHPHKTEVRFLEEEKLFSSLNLFVEKKALDNYHSKILKIFSTHLFLEYNKNYYLLDLYSSKKKYLEDFFSNTILTKLPFKEKLSSTIHSIYVKQNQELEVTHFVEGLNFIEFKELFCLDYQKSKHWITSKSLAQILVKLYDSKKIPLEDALLCLS